MITSVTYYEVRTAARPPQISSEPVSIKPVDEAKVIEIGEYL